MIDFEEELKKFEPSMEIEEAEDSIYNRDLTDMMDILQEMHEDIDYEKEKALVTDKILDSFDLVSLVSELTDAFDIEITAKDFVEENFNSLDMLVTMVKRLQEE